VLLARGLAGYRTGVLVADTATSRIATLAAGEVRITGTVQPAEVTLVSPLQSAPCVWYRAEARATGRGESDAGTFAEERAVGFRVRDATGEIRVFPRDARFDVPVRFREGTGPLGDPPPGLALRDGPAYATPAKVDREAAVAALLTVRRAEGDGFGDRAVDALGMRRGGARRYEEARLEPGDVVTVLGTAVPFGHLPDPGGHDRMDRRGDPGTALEDPEVADSLARAQAAGALLPPEQAWGNAAIPGFGIGRPVRAPDLDPGATAPELATAEEAAANDRTYDLTPDLLVLAAEPAVPLVIAAGAPGDTVARHESRLLVGLLGGILAIGSAIVLALAAGGVLVA
jgi:hypothetical protein